MLARRASLAIVSVLLLVACDAGITGPTYEHLASLSLSGGFTCAVDMEGRAFCWGSDNHAGQLGNGTNAPSDAPMRVKTGARFLQVVTGGAHACGLTTQDRVLCWGDNSQSQLGVTTTDLDCTLLQSNGWTQDFGNDCSLVPVPVQTDLKFVELGASAEHTCGRTREGTLWCWGAAFVGLGDSAGTSRSDSLIRVAAPASFVSFGMGPYHTCASDAAGQGYCWGIDGEGELGLGAAGGVSSNTVVPRPINSSTFIKRWALGQNHTCALTGGGEAICWGYGSSGQRGDSTTNVVQRDPTFVATSRRFTRIAAGGASTCALEAGTGAAWCWGENSDGRLGDGSTTDRVSPTPVLGGLSFTRLAMWNGGYPSAGVTCGISADGTYCWGLLPQPLTFGE